MRNNYTRQQVVQARIQIEEFQEAVMIWTINRLMQKQGAARFSGLA